MSNKAVIHTEKAPAAIGPYSQAIKAGTAECARLAAEAPPFRAAVDGATRLFAQRLSEQPLSAALELAQTLGPDQSLARTLAKTLIDAVQSQDR